MPAAPAAVHRYRGRFEPDAAFAEVSESQPPRLQRRCDPHRRHGIAILAAPVKCGPQIVEVGIGLINTVRVVNAHTVERSGHRRVMISVAPTGDVGLAGLRELLLRVLPHRLQQPVARAGTGVLGHRE